MTMLASPGPGKEKAARATRRSQRCYVKNSRLTFGEDRTHEFKGHRNLSSEEIPRRLHSRQSVSRNINGFLNTGQGGKIYLGVLDDGTVAGLALSEMQKDHVRISLDDLMNRYLPRVPSSRYRLGFVPVLAETERDKRSERGWEGERGRERGLERARGWEEEDSGVGLDGSEEGEAAVCSYEERMRGHLLRSERYCWCDKAARATLQNTHIQGVSIPYYVVEISILPFVRDPTLPPMVLQLHPIYQNEQGRCYFRGSTSLLQYSYQQVAELTIGEVQAHFERIKEKLREELKECMVRVTSALAELARQQATAGRSMEGPLYTTYHQNL